MKSDVGDFVIVVRIAGQAIRVKTWDDVIRICATETAFAYLIIASHQRHTESLGQGVRLRRCSASR